MTLKHSDAGFAALLKGGRVAVQGRHAAAARATAFEGDHSRLPRPNKSQQLALLLSGVSDCNTAGRVSDQPEFAGGLGALGFVKRSQHTSALLVRAQLLCALGLLDMGSLRRADQKTTVGGNLRMC